MAGTALSRLVSQTGAKTFVPTPISEKNQAGCETCLEIFDFRSGFLNKCVEKLNSRDLTSLVIQWKCDGTDQ